MALVSGGRSTLNPNAPLFIPAAFRQVEDFSPEWWELIKTSTWYRDYWLSQHQDEEGLFLNSEDDLDGSDLADLLPDTFDLDAGEDLSHVDIQFNEFVQSYESEVEYLSSPLHSYDDAAGQVKGLSLMKSVEERSPKSSAVPAKYADKPAKHVNPRYSPRCIQQPR